VAQNGAKSYMKEDYEEIYALKTAEKQSQTKPNSRAPPGNTKYETRNPKQKGFAKAI